MPDIDFGQLSEALNDKMDRDAHNVQSPSAVVIAKQDPTSDNDYTWYRLYSDGWVEQGGKITVGESPTTTTHTMSLPITMANTGYSIFIEGKSMDTSSNTLSVQYGNYYYGAVWESDKTTVSFKYRAPVGGCWRVEGIAA